MSKRLKPVLLPLMLAAGMVSAGEPEEKPLALVSTPAPVQKAILSLVGDGRLEEIDSVAENGERSYEVDYTTKKGSERSFTVADDGTLLSQEVMTNEVLPALRRAIQAEAPGWMVEEVDENLEDSPFTYDVEVAKAGHERSFTLDADGVLISREIELTNAPAAVRMAVTNEVPGGQVESVDENIDDDRLTYDVEATSTNGVTHSFCLDATGGLVSRQVTLNSVPPPTRRTIKLQVGDGKILRIDRLFQVKIKSVNPFEVSSRKDGQPYYFLVGPYGRFFGREE